MVAISDINKLAPELLNKSLAELERQKAQIELAMNAIREREKEKAGKEREAKIAEAREKIAEEAEKRLHHVTTDIEWLLRHDMVLEKTIEVMTKSNGARVPSDLFRRKLPSDFIPPEYRTGEEDYVPRTKRGKATLPPVLNKDGEKIGDVALDILKKNGPMDNAGVTKALSADPVFSAAIKGKSRLVRDTLAALARSKKVQREGDIYKAV